MVKQRLLEDIDSEQRDSEVALKGYEILTYPADFTLEVIVGKWNKKEIQVPLLQRKFIWTQVRASKLIESFLMGLPVPPVFFYLDSKNKLLVVDGHQRLRSIVYFFSGVFGEKRSPEEDIEFSLIGLDEHSPYLDATYKSLRATDQAAFNRLNNSVLRSFVVKQIHPEDNTSVFQIFERLNTGGVILQGQEIRNCIYEGPFNNSLNNLNKYDAWRKIVGTPIEDKRKRDVELILRFLALHFNLENYEKPMKQFLNDFMSKHRYAEPQRIQEFETLFKTTANAVLKYLGSKPFHVRAGLNAAAYDATFAAFAQHLRAISKSGVHLKSKFEHLVRDRKFLKYISAATTDADIIPKRIRKASRILFG